MCSGLPSSGLPATKCGQSRGWQSWLSLIQLHMAPITSCKYWTRCFFLTKFWKLSQYPAKRKFIRTGFAQFLSPIDFSFLLQFSLTRCNNNHNLGNWQAAMNNWYGCILSKSQKTVEPLQIQFNNNCSFNINIIANNNHFSWKVQKYWHLEIFTLSFFSIVLAIFRNSLLHCNSDINVE